MAASFAKLPGMLRRSEAAPRQATQTKATHQAVLLEAGGFFL